MAGSPWWRTAPTVSWPPPLALGCCHKETIPASYRPLAPTRDANHDINSPYLVSHRSNFNPVEISVGFAVSEQFLYFLASPHLAAVGTSPIRGKEMGEENLFPNLCPVCELSAS